MHVDPEPAWLKRLRPWSPRRLGPQALTRLRLANWLLVRQSRRMANEKAGPVERVWRNLSAAARSTLESELAPADLRTLQIDLARTRAAKATPASLMRRWAQDRFVAPATTDQRLAARIEGRLWELLPSQFVAVELSPVVPVGTCSAVARVDQNRIVSTARGTEVVSDPTNALALEAAWRRRRRPADRIDLATAHRVLRAQTFETPAASAHFRLFALVSSSRDRGSAGSEAEMLLDHVGFWQAALADLLPHRRSVVKYTLFAASALADRIVDTVRPALDPHAVTEFTEDSERTRAAGYYSPAAIEIAAEVEGAEVDLGDGGFVDWTAQFLENAKERCLVSCLSTTRVAALMGG